VVTDVAPNAAAVRRRRPEQADREYHI